MPTIRLAKIDEPLGFALNETGKEGSQVQIQTRGAITSDHPDFQRCINQIAAAHIEGVSAINVDTVFQFLVVVHQDESAETHVNEVPVLADIYGKGAIQAGQLLRDSDVANIKTLRFANVNIADRQGYLLLQGSMEVRAVLRFESPA